MQLTNYRIFRIGLGIIPRNITVDMRVSGQIWNMPCYNLTVIPNTNSFDLNHKIIYKGNK